jgi:pyruvate-ferredoxin/flavodoxin oxidoreductase
VVSGHWPLYRYDPRLREQGKNPLQLDSKPPSVPLRDYIYNENRYRMLVQSDPEVAEKLLQEAQRAVLNRWQRYEQMAAMEFGPGAAVTPPSSTDEEA